MTTPGKTVPIGQSGRATHAAPSPYVIDPRCCRSCCSCSGTEPRCRACRRPGSAPTAAFAPGRRCHRAAACTRGGFVALPDDPAVGGDELIGRRPDLLLLLDPPIRLDARRVRAVRDAADAGDVAAARDQLRTVQPETIVPVVARGATTGRRVGDARARLRASGPSRAGRYRRSNRRPAAEPARSRGTAAPESARFVSYEPGASTPAVARCASVRTTAPARMSQQTVTRTLQHLRRGMPVLRVDRGRRMSVKPRRPPRESTRLRRSNDQGTSKPPAPPLPLPRRKLRACPAHVNRVRNPLARQPPGS